jgi:hypothetical protein
LGAVAATDRMSGHRVPPASANSGGRGNHLARGDRMDDSTVPRKTCSKCGRDLPATNEFFHANKSSRDGLKGQCKPCRCTEVAAYKTEHADECRERNRLWAIKRRARRTPEETERDRARSREYMRLHRERDHEAAIQRGRAWWKSNSPRLSEKRRERYKTDSAYRERLLEGQREARKSGKTQDTERVRRAKRRAWFYANLRILKAAQGCSVCGRHDGRLDHHHLDPSTKRYSVSKMCTTSLETFIDEIAKCTVLCASCHASLPKRKRP